MSREMPVAEAGGGAVGKAQPYPGHPRRWWILGALSLSLMVIGLDLTVLSVALPVLVADLKATTTELQWIMDSYILVLAALLLPAGSLGDRIGRKRVLIAGLALFLAGSLLCAYASSAGSLIWFRAFMGLGGAIVMPLTLSVLPAIFSEQERPRAIAVWSVISGVSIALGPIVGGWLLDHYFWGSVFLFNVPFIVAALVAVIWLVPESRDPRPRRSDPVGVLLAAAGLTSLVYAIIERPIRGWDWVTLTTLAAGLALLAAFAAWEARSRQPMLNVRLFANPRFTWATVGFGLVGLVLTGAMFLFTQYLQDVEGYRPFDAGLRVIPMVAGLLVGAQVSSRLLPRIGTKVAMSAGFTLLAASLVLFGTVSVHTGYGLVALCLALMGAGLGTAMTPGLDAIMGAMPEGEFGAGSAVAGTFRQVGGAIGVALLGGIYLNRYVAELHLPAGLPAPVVHIARQSVGAANAVAAKLPAPLAGQVRAEAHAAFMSGLDWTMLIAAMVAVLAAALVAALLPGRNTATQARKPAMPTGPTMTAPGPDRHDSHRDPHRPRSSGHAAGPASLQTGGSSARPPETPGKQRGSTDVHRPGADALHRGGSAVQQPAWGSSAAGLGHARSDRGRTQADGGEGGSGIGLDPAASPPAEERVLPGGTSATPGGYRLAQGYSRLAPQVMLKAHPCAALPTVGGRADYPDLRQARVIPSRLARHADRRGVRTAATSRSR